MLHSKDYHDLVEKKFKHCEKHKQAFFYLDKEKVEIVSEGSAIGKRIYFDNEGFLKIFENTLKHHKLLDYWKT